MRTLVIPDVHDKVETVHNILRRETFDQKVFLGDFFDDWTTGEDDARRTAIDVKEWLHEPNTTVILGNHDASYGWAKWNAAMTCSGFTPEKHRAIHKVLDWEDWKLFRLHAWVDGWLLTHAGLHEYHMRDGYLPTFGTGWKSTFERMAASALASLHGPVPYERGRLQPLLGCGRERGGRQPYGGVTWCDFGVLDPPDGVDQLCGHTADRDYRYHQDADGTLTVCIDTNLRHYGIIEDGVLTVKHIDPMIEPFVFARGILPA